MAFANAFPGVCHSMAHKLGAFHHLPHGIANALLIRQVLRFNAAKVSVKMGTFSQYDHPHTLSRYAEVADCLKLDGNTDEEKLEKLINAITELMHKIGIHKENMAHTRRCLSCGDTAGRRRTVLSAGECSCVRGVSGCKSQHRTEAQQE